jgi:hypothetical protein
VALILPEHSFDLVAFLDHLQLGDFVIVVGGAHFPGGGSELSAEFCLSGRLCASVKTTALDKPM